jgi:NADH-quinone oxidoreductase subunit L
MPITFWLMWIATLAIAGIPPLSGFFSKDEILGAAFARAESSALADASLFGIGGGTWLYLVYVLGVAAAFLTAIYMTRLMIYTFHGPEPDWGDRAFSSARSAVGDDRAAGRSWRAERIRWVAEPPGSHN